MFVINCTFIMLATYAGVKYFRFRPTEYQDEAIGKRTKRLTSALIIIFIIPSIKSSVQNVSITKGQSFNRDSTSGNAVISIVVDSSDSISISDLEELKQWLKIRLDTETIDVTQR